MAAFFIIRFPFLVLFGLSLLGIKVDVRFLCSPRTNLNSIPSGFRRERAANDQEVAKGSWVANLQFQVDSSTISISRSGAGAANPEIRTGLGGRSCISTSHESVVVEAAALVVFAASTVEAVKTSFFASLMLSVIGPRLSTSIAVRGTILPSNTTLSFPASPSLSKTISSKPEPCNSNSYCRITMASGKR
ncbi:BQ5605_C012g06977 [Microbotryum silenes-dioicae]|uniref:BQ5605_C012g06977 protein n=1 Tax=Microbotryum silenes-dioicae TaxID=796604 RepID=A0A2X0ME17_9BASI|nr:BQ5605_C012g06977 [Microbotryum silenes-dioicae]